MSNILAVLPDFDLSPYSHIIPSLERACIAVVDLLTLDALDLAKRAQVPPGEVKKLADALLSALHRDVSAATYTVNASSTTTTNAPIANPISTLDDGLDAALGGGLFPGHLIEIVGERYAIGIAGNANYHVY
jgi:DNA repair protein RAD57